MNLFCFTLEGSTESMYEPAYSQTIRQVLPKYQCSPALLRRRPEWGGSDPAINSSKSQSTKLKHNNRRSCFLTYSLDNDTTDIHRACWISSSDKKDLAHQKKVPHKEAFKTSKDDKVNGLDLERIKMDTTVQGSETAADTAESIKARRLKKLQNLVPTKKGGQQSATGKEKNTSDNYDRLADVLTSYNPVLTCIGLGKRTEKDPSVTSLSSQQRRDSVPHDHSEEESVWSPLESPSQLSCHQPGHDRHELWECGSALSLPRTAEWDRFESLIQELDSRQSDLCLAQMARSITDLDLHQEYTLSRFGRFDAFRQQCPLMKAQDNGSCVQDLSGDSNGTCLKKKKTEAMLQSDREPIKAKETPTSITMKEVGGGREFAKGHSNSLESLYSSWQSSSSGVTSGSNCSSNRGSLRLDEDVPPSRHFCGRARVHTEFVPSPYDTESLKLKVGDVIDIIAKHPMGTWTGMLNNKAGNFKFIYVDLLKEDSPDSPEQGTELTCVQKLLQRFGLEEYALTLHRYQTAEDLWKLRERHLIELSVTDPEHRQRLLAAVSTLQPLRLHSDSQWDNKEAVYENIKNCPRDSGCVMGSVSPDCNTELYFPSEHGPAELLSSS